MKKIISLMLTFVMLICTSLCMTVNVSAASVKLSKSSVTLAVGTATTITLNGTTENVTWKTSDKTIATVSKGKISGKSIGTATITATSGGKSYTCKVTVKQYIITRSASKIAVGENAAFKVRGKTDGKTITWSSSDKTIAKVSKSGNVTGVSAGTCKIYAKIGTKKISSSITVTGGGFQVSGTKLLDANGNEFIMRGVNYPHSWFKSLLNIGIPAIAETGANTVRIVLSDGQQYNKNNLSDVKNVIAKCKENKLICVLEVHDVTGNDSVDALMKTADYWIEIKDALKGEEAYVILNIANEWMTSWDTALWKEGYTKAIKAIRDAGITNTIMVDSAGYGQNSKVVNDAGKEVLAADKLGNTMFSVHMYGYSGKSENMISRSIEYGTNNNLCIIVGEFGYKHSDGDIDEAYILKYCKENNIGWLGWSWKGNGGGAEYLDIAVKWDGSELSADWGEILVNGENGIKKTSEICSVFA